ncbi:MAG: SPOUT family RNA methylase [Candidatus Njordarchaeales archaeon]
MVSVILKVPRGFEKIVASRVLEIFPEASVIPRPYGYEGIVFVDRVEPDYGARVILENIPEVEKALPVHGESIADPDSIAETAFELARKYINPGESFAVRTTRRGSHDFTSIDINVIVGARIKEGLGNPVNLEAPDKVVWVEIFRDRAYISITREQAVRKPKGENILFLLSKISVIQIPFVNGDPEGAYRMGVRIGRAAQAFEIGELVIAIHRLINIEDFEAFLKGVLEGRASRYEIQRKTYGRKIRLVPVRIYEIFQLARARYGELFIITSARGKWLDEETCRELGSILTKEKRINIFAGAREGVPTGLMRWAKYTINLCPGVTFATEHTIPAVVSTLVLCYNSFKKKEGNEN